MIMLLLIVIYTLMDLLGKLAEAKKVLKDAIATLEGSVTAKSDFCKVCFYSTVNVSIQFRKKGKHLIYTVCTCIIQNFVMTYRHSGILLNRHPLIVDIRHLRKSWLAFRCVC